MRKRGKRLVVMIPCLNEEKTLPLVIKSTPKKIPGIDKIETLVIDDGSTDKTYEVAKKMKVAHILRYLNNKGLAQSFADGISFCLEAGYDIIVNTDGDNQYPQEDIPRLIKPILEGKAEMVIADRQTDKIKHFSPIKKILQKFGSWVVRFVSGTNVPDAVSGFRAYSREAALQMNIVSDFSYTIETIIQAGKKKIPIASIPIKVNPQTRDSRLFKSNWGHIKKSAATVIRIFTMYEPLKVFSYIAGLIFLSGIVLVVRFLYYFFTSGGSGHVQSLLLAAIFLIIGFQIFLIGIVADLIANNRKLLETFLYKDKKNQEEILSRLKTNHGK
jgi:glycosyltransferase involved in cell wall biosynthesis